MIRAGMIWALFALCWLISPAIGSDLWSPEQPPAMGPSKAAQSSWESSVMFVALGLLAAGGVAASIYARKQDGRRLVKSPFQQANCGPACREADPALESVPQIG